MSVTRPDYQKVSFKFHIMYSKAISFLFCIVLPFVLLTACSDENDVLPTEVVGQWDFVSYGNDEMMTDISTQDPPTLTISQNGYFVCQAINQIIGHVTMEEGNVVFSDIAPNSLIKVVSPNEIIFLEENFLKVYRYVYSNGRLRLYYAPTDYFLLTKHLSFNIK